MKKILIVFCIPFLKPLLFAVGITVGGTRLSIPAPPGFSPITSEMKPYADIAERFVSPTNQQFALFLPNTDVVLAISGGLPKPRRWFCVQTAKIAIERSFTDADFTHLKRTLTTQNEEIIREAEAKVPGYIEIINKGIFDDYGIELGLSVTRMLPLPPNFETEQTFAYSMLSKISANDESSNPTVYEAVSTATFLHVQSKVLFLHVYAEKSGLEWSRAESKKWADMIIEANPSVGAVAALEGTGYDWSHVAAKAIPVAIVCVLVPLLSYLFRKREG